MNMRIPRDVGPTRDAFEYEAARTFSLAQNLASGAS